MATKAATKREVGYDWFEKHAIKGNKEIFQWSRSMLGSPPPCGPIPHINGALWESNEAIHASYEDVAQNDSGKHGFIRYACDYENCESFASWDEAVLWLMRSEDE